MSITTELTPTGPTALTGTAPAARPILEQLKERIPDHAKDLRINLGVIAGATALTPQQAWGTALASAITSRNAEVAAAIEEAAAAHLAPEARAAARGAASIMGMNNVYYRFLHMMSEAADAPAYASMPARLRMQIIGRPGVPHLDFELWCLAASAITGCAACVRSHERSTRDRGGQPEQVHEAVRIASVIHGVALALDTAAPAAA
jgi:alkyl hydroperoxide reductase subunit D